MDRGSPLAVGANILTAFVCQIAKGTKPQSDQLVVEGIELAERRDVQQRPTEEFDVPLEWALGRDQLGEATGDGAVLNWKGI